MRAVVVCCNYGWMPPDLLKRRPLALLPAGRVPLAQIVLERLLARGVRRVTFVVSDEADFVQGHFGGGERWNVEVDYVLLRRFEGIGETLRRLPGPRGEDLLILPGLVLADPDLARLAAIRERGALAALATFAPYSPIADGAEAPPDVPEKDIAAEITLLSPEAAAMLPSGLTRLAPRVAAWAYEGKAEIVRLDSPALVVEDFRSFWQAHLAALDDRVPLAGAPGLAGRYGLRSRIDRSVAFTAPVILGNDVEIGRGCRVGPNAVIGDGCILDEGVEAVNCLALAGTYFGPETSLVSAIADQGLLVRYPDGAATHVPDFFIMGPVHALSAGRGISRAIQRVVAALLIAMASPLLLALRLLGLVRPGAWSAHPFAGRARLEALSGEIGLPEIRVRLCDCRLPLLRYLPALLDVLEGTIDLVGVELIDEAQARALIGTWGESRLFCRPGLIPPWAGRPGPPPDDMERRVMEVYFANTRSLGADMRLLWTALKAVGRLFVPLTAKAEDGGTT